VAPLLDLRDLTVDLPTPHGWVQPVRQVSLTIEPGQTLGLVGESGSGKTLLALALVALLPAGARRSGQAWLASKNGVGPRDLLVLAERERIAIRGREIGVIFQEPMTALNPVMRIGAQIAESVRVHSPGLRAAEADARVIAALERARVPQPELRARQFPHQLSGGLRQRVMIAMALAGGPRLLVADEPTTALDVTVQKEILDLLRRLQEEMGLALLFITHDLGVVAQVARSLAVMYAGRIVEHGPVQEVLRHPRHPYTEGLLRASPQLGRRVAAIPGSVPALDALPPGCAFAPRCASRLEQCSAAVPEWGEGRSRPSRALPPASHGGKTVSQVPALLSARHLCKTFALSPGAPPLAAVDDVTLHVSPGDTLALVGESGSGKTTLARLLLRLIEPDAGKIHFDGQDLLAARGAQLRALRRRMQMIFQDPFSSLDPRLRVGAIVGEPLEIHEPALSRSERRARVAQALDAVGLEPRACDRFPHEFSGGQRQRIGIARAMILRPKLVVADEPVSALDVSIGAQILELLRGLQAEYGLTYVFISHNLPVVAQLATRVAVMQAGRLVEIGPVERVLAAPEHPYTQALLAAVPTLPA
jgi:oligopeptide/dipeptide ABC transporter ATP-binding protein